MSNQLKSLATLVVTIALILLISYWNQTVEHISSVTGISYGWAIFVICIAILATSLLYVGFLAENPFGIFAEVLKFFGNIMSDISQLLPQIPETDDLLKIASFKRARLTIIISLILILIVLCGFLYYAFNPAMFDSIETQPQKSVEELVKDSEVPFRVITIIDHSTVSDPNDYITIAIKDGCTTYITMQIGQLEAVNYPCIAPTPTPTSP